jgi:hypothetical protein
LFDFAGTFNGSQIARLGGFAREHVHEASARAAHLRAEATRVGTLVLLYDQAGNPVGYKASPSNSYVGRLVAAYEVLGGDVLHDLQVRSRSNPVFLVTGDEVSAPKIFSNGEPLPEKALADAPSAKLVSGVRGWIGGVVARREALERKVRRAIDYVDQLLDEADALDRVSGPPEDASSLEGRLAAITSLLADRTYRAIADDKGKDPYGKLTRAPFTAYDPGPGRAAPEGVGVERGEAGYLVYGDEGGEST